MHPPIFQHLKVIELANVLAGPSVGMFFAELGATVIKIENAHTQGDITRSWKLPTEDANDALSAYYHSINYGKQAHLLDLTQANDLAWVHQQIADADVVVSNFNDRAAQRLQLDYATLSALNPRLIYAQLYAFADQNDRRPAFDVVLQAEAGFLSMSGTADAPARMPVALIDILAGHQLKEAILIAMLQRERTGKGSFVHTSLMETAIASLANQAANWLHSGHLPKPMGMQHPNIAPYGDLVITSDGLPIVLAIGTEGQFGALCKALGLDYLLNDPRFSTNAARVVHRADLVAILNKVSETRPMDDWMRVFAEGGIPAGRINTVKQVFEQPWAQSMVLEQNEADGSVSRRVKTVAWGIG
jgi:crotonobetainyl-CoA:carnitine CoA-transferase CaiB-like acyl-CoA transferase